MNKNNNKQKKFTKRGRLNKNKKGNNNKITKYKRSKKGGSVSTNLLEKIGQRHDLIENFIQNTSITFKFSDNSESLDFDYQNNYDYQFGNMPFKNLRNYKIYLVNGISQGGKPINYVIDASLFCSAWSNIRKDVIKIFILNSLREISKFVINKEQLEILQYSKGLNSKVPVILEEFHDELYMRSNTKREPARPAKGHILRTRKYVRSREEFEKLGGSVEKDKKREEQIGEILRMCSNDPECKIPENLYLKIKKTETVSSY